MGEVRIIGMYVYPKEHRPMEACRTRTEAYIDNEIGQGALFLREGFPGGFGD